jgi:hypothetical protein
MRDRLLIFFILLAALFLSRAPFLNQILIGEEGSFAALVLSAVPASQVTPDRMPQMLIGSIGEEPVYYPFQRNITPYLLIEKTAGAALRALGVPMADPQQKTIAARLSYFAFFLVGTAGLLWLAARSWLGVAITVFALGTPLALGASIQPQIDGSTGVALVGLSCLLLLGSSRSPSTIALVLAGFLIAMGRHELSLAFGAAALITLSQQWMFKSPSRRQIALFSTGLAVGILTAILVSPADYAMGYTTMGRVYSSPSSRLSAVWAQLVFVWPVWLLMTVALAAVGWNRRAILKDRPEIILVSIGATAIAFGFAISGWSGDGFPRYYVPALVAFAYVLVSIRRYLPTLPAPLARTAVACFLIGVFVNARSLAQSWVSSASITSIPGVSTLAVRNQLAATATRTRADGTIALEQASLWIYHPRVDFIGADMGAEGARKLIEERYPDQLGRLSIP